MQELNKTKDELHSASFRLEFATKSENCSYRVLI